MKIIGAALGHHVDLNTQITTVLGRIGAGLDLHFLDCVHAGSQSGLRNKVGHDADAIERNAVLDFSRARANETLPAAWVSGSLEPVEHARSGNGKSHRVTPIQRQLRSRLGADQFVHHRFVRFDRCDVRSHFDFGADFADLQNKVRSDGLVGANSHSGLCQSLKTALLSRDRVSPGFHKLKLVKPFSISRRRVGFLRALVHRNHVRAADQRTRRISHVADQ